MSFVWRPWFEKLTLGLVATAFTVIGVLHFVRPAPFVAIIPPFFPEPLALVYVSGVFEVLGGLGVLLPATRRWAAWGLIALLIAVYPANIYHAFGDVAVDGTPAPLAYHIIRLPMQLVLIAWVYQIVRWERVTGDSRRG